jgi:hypothetical protein
MVAKIRFLPAAAAVVVVVRYTIPLQNKGACIFKFLCDRKKATVMGSVMGSSSNVLL